MTTLYGQCSVKSSDWHGTVIADSQKVGQLLRIVNFVSYQLLTLRIIALTRRRVLISLISRGLLWLFSNKTIGTIDWRWKSIADAVGVSGVISAKHWGGGLTFHTQLLLRVRCCNAWQTIMQNIHIIGKNIANSYHRSTAHNMPTNE